MGVRIVEEIHDSADALAELGVDAAMRKEIASALNTRLAKVAASGELWDAHNLSYILEYWMGGLVATAPPTNPAAVEAIRAHVVADANFVGFLERVRYPRLQDFWVFGPQGLEKIVKTCFSVLLLRRVFDSTNTVQERLTQIVGRGDLELGVRARALLGVCPAGEVAVAVIPIAA